MRSLSSSSAQLRAFLRDQALLSYHLVLVSQDCLSKGLKLTWNERHLVSDSLGPESETKVSQAPASLEALADSLPCFSQLPGLAGIPWPALSRGCTCPASLPACLWVFHLSPGEDPWSWNLGPILSLCDLILVVSQGLYFQKQSYLQVWWVRP